MKGERIQANLSLKEVFNLLCPKCKKKLIELTAKRVTEAQVKEALEGKKE